MSNDATRAPAELRIFAAFSTILGFDDALEALNTFELPDGAIASVRANSSIYMFDRASVAVPDGVNIVAPTAGPGRWIIYPPGAAQLMSFARELTTFPSQLFTLDQNWQDIPSLAAQFTGSGSAPFTLDAASGEMTYTGADGARYSLAAAITIIRDAPLDAHAAFSVNGDVVLGTTNAYVHEMFMFGDSATGGRLNMNLLRIVTLNNGDSIRIRYRNANGSGAQQYQVAREEVLLLRLSA
jgi:hypothetical protein